MPQEEINANIKFRCFVFIYFSRRSGVIATRLAAVVQIKIIFYGIRGFKPLKYMGLRLKNVKPVSGGCAPPATRLLVRLVSILMAMSMVIIL